MMTHAEMLHERMTRAFKLVEPAGHWKNPIHKVVTNKALFDAGVILPDVMDAVEYFTGTKATYTAMGPLEGLVTAPGYYAGPCN